MFKSKLIGFLSAVALVIGLTAQTAYPQGGTYTNLETLNLIFEGSTVDGNETTLTAQDPSTDRTITLPNATGNVSVGFTTDIILCGDLANAGTLYYSPVLGAFATAGGLDFGTGSDDWRLSGDGCAAEDSSTEGTADEILYVDNAFKVLGMLCEVTNGSTAAVVLSLRSAAADLTPSVTMTIATGDQTGVSTTGTTTDIAANATFALKSVTTTNESSLNVWCAVKILVVP